MKDRRLVARRGVTARSRPRISRTRKTDHGFTLVELLVVIVILGILSSVVVFAVRGSGKNATEVGVATDARIVRTALETYCATYDRYPSNDPPGAAMGELVAKRFLSSPSELNVLETGGSELPDGNCNGTRYRLTPENRTGVVPPSSPSTACNKPNSWCTIESVPPQFVHQGISPMVQLPNGKILVSSAEDRLMIYDPNPGDGSLGKWSLSNATSPHTFGPYSTLVLIGGTDAQCGQSCGKVIAGDDENNGDMALYNPTNDSWETIPPPADDPNATIHGGDSQILGPKCGAYCGKVMVFSYDTLYVWNPRTMGFETVGTVGGNRPYLPPHPYVLDNSRVLLMSPNGGKTMVFDPASSPPLVEGPDSLCRTSQGAGRLSGDKIILPCTPNPATNCPECIGGSVGTLTPTPCTDPVNPPLGTYCAESQVYDPHAGPVGAWFKMSSCGHSTRDPLSTDLYEPGGYCKPLASLPDGRVLAVAVEKARTAPYAEDGVDTWLYGPNPNGAGGPWTWNATLPANDQHSIARGIFISGPSCGKVCNSVLAAGNPTAMVTQGAPNGRSEIYQPPAM